MGSIIEKKTRGRQARATVPLRTSKAEYKKKLGKVFKNIQRLMSPPRPIQPYIFRQIYYIFLAILYIFFTSSAIATVLSRLQPSKEQN
jgi:hypothetical protein